VQEAPDIRNMGQRNRKRRPKTKVQEMPDPEKWTNPGAWGGGIEKAAKERSAKTLQNETDRRLSLKRRV